MSFVRAETLKQLVVLRLVAFGNFAAGASMLFAVGFQKAEVPESGLSRSDAALALVTTVCGCVFVCLGLVSGVAKMTMSADPIPRRMRFHRLDNVA